MKSNTFIFEFSPRITGGLSISQLIHAQPGGRRRAGRDVSFSLIDRCRSLPRGCGGAGLADGILRILRSARTYFCVRKSVLRARRCSSSSAHRSQQRSDSAEVLPNATPLTPLASRNNPASRRDKLRTVSAGGQPAETQVDVRVDPAFVQRLRECVV